MAEPLLEVGDLSVSFGTGRTATEVVHDVAFHIDPGETLAVVGESGSGKSVSAMSIVDLLPANARRSGTIRFNGEDLLTADPARIRQIRGAGIGVVFQEPMTALNPVYTIGALLAQAVGSHQQGSKSGIHTRSLDLLRLVQMPEPERRMDQFPHQLSGGQRQRAMIAMAIASDPKLIIADEATTALDVTAQAVILDLLMDVRERLGTAILLITHDMGVVADVADRVVVMNGGRVVEEATVDQLFSAPREEYTQKLLAAVPHLGRSEVVELTPTTPLDLRYRTQPLPVVDQPVLHVDNLIVDFPGPFGQRPFRAVDGVSFDVAQGEVVGLVGESGSGKSTIGRVVIGLTKPASGTVQIDGIDVGTKRRLEKRELRRRAAIIFQDPSSSLNPRATLGDTISSPLRWNGVTRNRRELDRIVAELLDAVHLPKDAIHRYPHELSGGQRQRVGIARAMALEPELLIADEPTSALDVSVQAAVLKLLLELQQRRQFSCVFISHDLSVVEQLAQRVVVLKDGKIAEQGDTRQILHHPHNAYTRRLVAAIPVPDPVEQRARRQDRQLLTD
ncbi:ABC transporter ATP-binding protein [Agromyces sp. Soil535]|uniref:dipeptide ABC transporter ATP-binding protein n=1 Tax=Agromyces sp. Soil535 TaxID=1736390 RepID=UPI0006FD3CDE|nr:ABC transporter ATP-binding protein [Agromyces sp. Soil535]KRE28215.1 glutathione ABC transporter ATP-binding protein [Agromyces sp. Soil535]